MTTQDLTSPVAAIQLAAGAFFSVKMATQDLTSPVAANQLAAGAFFRRKRPRADSDPLPNWNMKRFFGGSAWKEVPRFDFEPADLQVYYAK